MKKFFVSKLCPALLLVSMLSAVFAPALSADDSPFDYINADRPNTIEITKYSGNDTELLIPETIDGKTVIAVREDAFAGNATLQTVVLPNTIVRIGAGAFRNCAFLTAVSLSSALEIIEAATFENCPMLSEIAVPDSVTSIEARAFAGCSSLTAIHIGNGVSAIADGAFDGCASVSAITVGTQNTAFLIDGGVLYNADKTVLYKYAPAALETGFTMPETVTSVKPYAFEFATNLSYIKFSSALKEIGAGAFFACRALKAVTLPSKITAIPNDAFSGCSALSYVSLPAGVHTIGENAFYHCSALTYINFPTSLTEIGAHAFECCYKIEEIYISKNVAVIGEGAFSGCIALPYINIDPQNSNFIEYKGVLFNADQTVLLAYPAGAAATEYAAPDTVKTIAPYAFFYANRLTGVTLPQTLSEIGAYAFAYCSALSAFDVPAAVTALRQSTFTDCYALETVTVGEQVREIGDWVFDFCSNLTLHCRYNSATYLYAQENNIPVSLFSETVSLSTSDGMFTVTSDADHFSAETSLSAEAVTDEATVALGKRHFGAAAEFRMYALTAQGAAGTLSSVYTVTVNRTDFDGLSAFAITEDGTVRHLPLTVTTETLTFRTPSLRYLVFVDTDTHPLRGDVDGSCVLDNRDATMLLRYIGRWADVSISLHAADVTGDGVVNNRDATILLRYLAHWDGIVLQ